MSDNNTFTFTVECLKYPELMYRMLKGLGYKPEPGTDHEHYRMMKKYSDSGEYIDLEIEVDADMNIVGGRILPQ